MSESGGEYTSHEASTCQERSTFKVKFCLNEREFPHVVSGIVTSLLKVVATVVISACRTEIIIH